MSKKTVSLHGVPVWVSAETSLQDSLFFDWRHSTPKPNTALLGGSLADLTRSLYPGAKAQRCFLHCFNREADDPIASWLNAVLLAFRFPVDQRFSVSMWSSPDPLNDGCLTLLSISPSKLREQSSDVVAVIEAFVAEEEARHLGTLNGYLSGIYRGFQDERVSFNYGLLLRDDGEGPMLWVWSRPVFLEAL